MAAYCTCGAELVSDALFCHRCGKQQRAIAGYEPETPVVVPDIVLPQARDAARARATEVSPAAELDFHNRLAVRIAFVVALCATLLSWNPMLGILLWGAAGCVAAVLYHRRTGVPLSVKAGMRMGWITGVLVFAFNSVITSISLLPVASSGGLGDLFKKQIKNPTDPNVQEVLKILDTAPGMVAAVLISLAMLFVVITMLSIAGGALGAKFASRKG